MSVESHSELMAQCIELARKGAGFVEPNPCVGAIVVKENEVVGRGYHQSLGGPHAEVNALHEAGAKAQGADLYITLEPCSTTGRTPPCTTAIISSGIRRVFIGALDPNKKHAGRALPLLEAAGIQVLSGVLKQASERLIADFEKQLGSDRPIVVAKWASTMDGCIATRTGDSQWITGIEARTLVHEERARCDGILVGVGTILADDPALTVRHVKGESPRPVILDSHLETPIESAALSARHRSPVIYCQEEADPARLKALRSSGVVVVPCPTNDRGLDLSFVLSDLSSRDVGRVLVEGGAKVLGSFLDQGFVDFVQVFLAPKVLGDCRGLSAISGRDVSFISETVDFEWLQVDRVGQDLRLVGRVANSDRSK